MLSVSIVGTDGAVVAGTQFTSQARPGFTNAETILQLPVQVAGGAVYYADGAGVVRRLMPDRSVSVAATFPLTSDRQLLSWAVSPDGKHVIAIVITMPPLHNPPPQSLSDPFLQEGAHWLLSVEKADYGGPTAVTLTRDLGSYPAVRELRPTLVVGWDAVGPIATLNTGLATQDGLRSARFNGDQLIHIGQDGTHLDRLGGSDCHALDELVDGTVLCASAGSIGPDSISGPVQVRTRQGEVVWTVPVAESEVELYLAEPLLSPDGDRVVADGVIYGRPQVASAERSIPGVVRSCGVEGWLDQYTVIVRTSSGTGFGSWAVPCDFRRVDLPGQFVGVL
jgi:hypothetical protein